MSIRPPVKYHGGKGRLHKWIVPLLPEHKIYCEPFGGAASVLLNKDRAERECYNDLEPRIVNLLTVIRDQFEELYSSVVDVPYDKETYLAYRERYRSDEYDGLSPLDKATLTYVVKRMSRGGLEGTFSWAKRQYSTGPSEVHCWKTSLDNLRLVSKRLQGVEIKNECAFGVIGEYDGKDSLFYFDPPYLHATRSSPRLYKKYEMKKDEHLKLAEVCKSLRGKIVLSGYPSEMYSEIYSGWRVIEKPVGNHSSHRKVKDTMCECLWMNF